MSIALQLKDLQLTGISRILSYFDSSQVISNLFLSKYGNDLTLMTYAIKSGFMES